MTNTTQFPKPTWIPPTFNLLSKIQEQKPCNNLEKYVKPSKASRSLNYNALRVSLLKKETSVKSSNPFLID